MICLRFHEPSFQLDQFSIRPAESRSDSATINLSLLGEFDTSGHDCKLPGYRISELSALHAWVDVTMNKFAKVPLARIICLDSGEDHHAQR